MINFGIQTNCVDPYQTTHRGELMLMGLTNRNVCYRDILNGFADDTADDI